MVYLRSEKQSTRTPSSIPGTGSELANISHWTRSRSICWSAPVEMALRLSFIRRFMIYCFYFQKCKISLTFLRRPDLAGYEISGAEIESPYL